MAPTLEAIGERAALVVSWNGAVVRCDVDDSYAAKGLVVGAASDVAEAASLYETTETTDAFTKLNAAFTLDPIVIDIPAGVVVSAPIVVLHWVGGENVAAFPRVVVRSGEDSEATVCEYSTSADDTAVVVPVTTLEVGNAARLNYVNVQNLESKVWQIGRQSSTLGSDATLRSTSVALGGDYARVRTDSNLRGKGGTANLRAVYFGAGTQVHDFRTLQGHHAPKTTSDLLFKGAVGDDSRSVYSGLIRVENGAHGTNAFQTNRNLVLSEGAHADSVPNLEIEENDVKCSHASAVGPVDEEQLYYLESRGVPTDVAERLIVLGFLQEVLEELPVPGLRSILRSAVASKLDSLAERGALA